MQISYAIKCGSNKIKGVLTCIFRVFIYNKCFFIGKKVINKSLRNKLTQFQIDALKGHMLAFLYN